MVIVLIATLVATIATGVLMSGHEDLWEELHEGLASLSLVLIVVHILGVIAASLLHNENLVQAMLTGFKLRKHTDV
jgi:cytochrome b